ncbi:MAG TPA: cytochrome c biogenesis protein CcdA [Chloroflexota bacterium]|nr:cytochrome c biogenesis protein CcdA [Chloroflexota bacterium]HUM67248.1 cytochrome c biogenesis protein CcdA [Chloroflexota bacterium]
MTRSLRLHTIAIVSLLGLIALGAVALTGFWHPEAPAEAMRAYLPQITLPTVILAGLVDGINPCAFTVLLLFITALLATLQAGQHSVNVARMRLIGMGSIYIGAIFFTYLALGVGLLKSVDFFTQQHALARLGALFAILFGLWMVKDYFLPDVGWQLQAPGKVGAIARQSARKATIPALVAGGFLIGLCTVPCSGAVYLGVLSLLALQPTALLGYGYLVLYNVVFVLPLVAILVAASARPTLNRLAHWNLHHKEWVRLALGGGVIVMGLVILVMV